jgi:hypothetical protein
MTRASELSQRLEELRGWGTLTLTTLWAQVDPEDVRGSFLAVHPALVTAHRVLVAEALDAVDHYMFLVAADDGLLYRASWRNDVPGRPLVTAQGRNATEYIARAPYVVLNRIKRGYGPAKSMTAGLNYLGRLYGTEAHRAARVVMWDRFEQDQLEAAG